ncbi:hypothetical protein AC578_10284 [Pseudocercospora eumusae]|uniref:AB hydrolase-1 domain-containing protein n=1 Tax=Pseudocercospora eumusae TaxID=321146 RepID=A0A139HRI9_9PEZI|nr:hypothetical protein AC578_10284 [Pseudocercospora eumusae]
MAASKPSIVFVPGGWHSPTCYDKVATLLQASGYPTSYVHLPSIGDPNPKYPNFLPDIGAIRSRLMSEISQDKRVLLVVHSYSGVPGSEAVRGLDLKTRQEKGLKGGVQHIFYTSSFLVPEGKSLSTAFPGDGIPPLYDISEDGLTTFPRTPNENFYNEMSEEEQICAAKHLSVMSYKVLSSEVTFAAWKFVPSTYLFCNRDQAIPIFLQRKMVEEWAEGYEVRTEWLDTDHSPFYSKAEEMAKMLKRAAG